MKFFIDSANINEVKEGISLGMVDGVTTNPSLIAKEKGIRRGCKGDPRCGGTGRVSLEDHRLGSSKGMVREGKKLAKLGANAVIKVPMTTEGLKATRIFADAGIRVNQTLIFSAVQALMAAKAGVLHM